jgi:hypothetical protein
MDLVQSRIVTDDVERLAAFYARLVRVSVVLNHNYVEVPTGANEARSGTALLPLRTFRLPGIASANAAALLPFSAVIPVFFFLTL